ncbi:S-layer homology domain-containing protein [Chryseomicrobium sp. FSL W7-1435]|uniref:S-layer homology domain-containing protein n=1 Tax=Chryseomicrobium sp. FSL W7-1435 TaxID=2921704 RepID=UPI003159CAB8
MNISSKKITQAALAAALATGVFATTASANGATFSDIPEANVHYDNIYNLANRSVITGYPDGTYQPARQLTRAEAAVILTNALDLDTSFVENPGFPDVKKGAWYYEEIAILAEYGIMNGHTNGKFGPNDKLTRAQMASILTAAYYLYPANFVETPFTDVVEGSWYDDYVQALYHFGVTSGVSKTKFAPNDFVRRDAMASFVVNSENVSEEAKSEEWMLMLAEMYNDNRYNPMKASVDTKTNTITVTIAPTTRQADLINTTELFYSIIPFYDFAFASVKGSNYDLSWEDYEEATREIFKSLGVSDAADLNEVGGKSVTFTFEGWNGEMFEYTVVFKNQ